MWQHQLPSAADVGRRHRRHEFFAVAVNDASSSGDGDARPLSEPSPMTAPVVQQYRFPADLEDRGPHGGSQPSTASVDAAAKPPLPAPVGSASRGRGGHGLLGARTGPGPTASTSAFGVGALVCAPSQTNPQGSPCQASPSSFALVPSKGQASTTIVDDPRRIVVLGAPSTGKSSFINAFRQATSPSTRWEVATVGRVGRNTTGAVEHYFNTSGLGRPPTWHFIDCPGKTFADVTTPGSSDARLLSVLMHGLPHGTPISGRQACTIDELETVAAHFPTHRPDHAVIVIKATDIVTERGRWGGFGTRLDAVSNHERTVNALADLIDGVHHELSGRAPHVVVTHMDKFTSHNRRHEAETSIRKILGEICPQTNLHFVGLPLETSQHHDVQSLGARRTSIQVPTLPSGASRQPLSQPAAEVGRPGSSDLGNSGAPSSLSSTVPRSIVGLATIDAESHQALTQLHRALTIEVASHRQRATRVADKLSVHDFLKDRRSSARLQ